jgi:hypothetical protein
LEDRALLAYSPNIAPMILTTGGFIVLSTPPGLSSALNTTGSNSPGSGSGGFGGNGGNMPTSFNIAGFGPSSLAIGNVTGFPSLNLNSGSGSGGFAFANFGGAVGSGANASGSNGASPTTGSGTFSNFAAYGSSFSSGYSFGLSVTNNFGMTSTTLGSVPVHTYDNGTAGQPEQPPGQGQDGTEANRNNVLQSPPPLGPAAQGPATGPGNNLLRRLPTLPNGMTPNGLLPNMPGAIRP